MVRLKINFKLDDDENDQNKPKTSNTSDTDEDGKQEEAKKPEKKRFGKNPLVDTSFLPDKEREMEEDAFRYGFKAFK